MVKYTPYRSGVRINAVCVDWGGTISDDRAAAYESNMRVLEAHGQGRFPFEEWKLRVAPTVVQFFRRNGVLGDDQTLFGEYKAAYLKVRKEGIHPTAFPDAKATISKLSGMNLPIGVVSRHPTDFIIKESLEYQLSENLRVVLGDIMDNEADKSIAIKMVCEQFGVMTSNVVYIGDMARDIKAAKQAGVHSVGITTGYHSREQLLAEGPDLGVVASLSEFCKLVLDGTLR